MIVGYRMLEDIHHLSILSRKYTDALAVTVRRMDRGVMGSDVTWQLFEQSQSSARRGR
jgi:hypothetical protein